MIHHRWELGLVGWAFAAVLLAGLYLRQRQTRDATAVDAGWAFSIVGIAIIAAVLGPGCARQRALIAALVAIENGRIGVVVLRRLGHEDRRYRDLRARWAGRGREQLTFAIFYQAQAALAALLCLPVVLACFNNDRNISAVEWVGVALWLVAALAEGVADRQLRRFVADAANKGHTLTSGLWRYSRHPNYFFQSLTWLAYGLVAVAAPWGWLGFASYILILYFILFVTGVGPAEADSPRTRSEEFRRYQSTTSAFVPWFPKSN